jgi:hypothetical protein
LPWSKSDEEEYTLTANRYEDCLKNIRHYIDRLDALEKQLCDIIERNIDD